MTKHHSVNYIEIPAKDLNVTKAFFAKVFGWSFIDYGPDYCSFTEGIDGGFFTSDMTVSSKKGSVLVVLYSDALENTLSAVEAAGGSISQTIFSFPGGRRFHFLDPNGNEYAVWSE